MSATIRDPLVVRSASAARLAVKRLLKVGIACGVLTVGVYAIWSAQGIVVTDNAVVSAYVTSLRAPIEGFVSASHTQVGSEIGRGEILATVTNPRVDDQRLATLQERMRRLDVEKAAITRQRDRLETAWRDLTHRAEEYRRAMVSQLTGQVEAPWRQGDRRASRQDAIMRGRPLW
jgi:multidrug resistance efflux pump